MKKFKVNFGIQRLDSDFDEIYTESKFYKFPEVKDLPNQMKVEVDNKYDKYTLIGTLAFSNEEYENLNEKWYEWINSENGKSWIKREVPECEDFIIDGWVIMIDSEEID